MAKMLSKAPQRARAEQIVTEIESLGGTIDSHGGNNSFGVHVEVLSGDFPLSSWRFSRSHPQAAFPAPELGASVKSNWPASKLRRIICCRARVARCVALYSATGATA
jgi:hypothetical protein